MKYVDGFVLVVKKGRLAEYRKMARDAGKIWKKHGALAYVEAIGDDMNPKMEGMEMVGFEKMSKARQGEDVFFSYIVYKNKAHRDAVNKKVMVEMKEISKNNPNHMKNMPFDMKRFSYGGFKAIVDL